MADPRTTWWIWRKVQTRLTKWTLALLHGRRYTIRLEAQGSGYHDRKGGIIQANPQMFPGEPPETQFRLTQGLLAHEVGHAVFTDGWPERPEQQALRWIVNVLEDQRIEKAICIYYPGLAAAIRLLGDLTYAEQSGLGRLPPTEQALGCCLAWRWAHDRGGEAEMLEQLDISAVGQGLWAKVRPLVETAWNAPDTTEVIQLSEQILELLGLPPARVLPVILAEAVGDDVQRGLSGCALPFPTSACDHAQPGLGTEPGKGGAEIDAEENPGEDVFSAPAPYTTLEDAARPAATRLAEALKLPLPDVRPLPHEWQGRYSFRQEVRTPETPHLQRSGVDRGVRSLALYVLVDRSGSMSPLDEDVRLALMTIYLAATDLSVPTGIAYFGANSPGEAVFEVASLSPQASESAKALIAGYEGSTSQEFLDWGLRLAEEALRPRAEKLRALLVLHDGQPVYSGKLGNDRELSLARLRRLERIGITTIGVYLGNDPDDLSKLRQLFTRLVVCSGKELPEKLGNLLRSLA